MLQQLIRLVGVGCLPFFLVLSGCGGSDDTPVGTLTDPNIALSSLVVEGYDIGFSPDRVGPYNIQVPNSVTSLSVTATANRSDLVIDTYFSSTLGEVTSEQAETLTSGTAHQYNLAEGTNIIVIRVRDNDVLLLTSYTLMVNRVSTTASLVGAAFRNLLASENESPYFALDKTFDPDTYSYTVNVPYANCTSYFIPFTNNVSTGLDVTAPGRTVNNARSSDAIYFDLPVGQSQLSAELTSEDGLNTATYSFTLNRAAGTADQIAANANLASLNLSPGEFNFFCGVSAYPVMLVNNNVNEVEIVAQPENSAASIEINEESYVNGEIYTLVLESEGVTEVEIEVTSEDGDTTRTYLLAVQRSERNVIRVDTAEELQIALQNAQPNDEIQVVAGTYTGVASLATSGSDTAHFASAQSGTAEQPIYLTAQSIYADSILSGSDSAQNAVLELSGDYWIIVGLKFENARNGIVLDGASNNALRTVQISNTGAQGLIMRNGSSNNSVSAASFGDTGVALTGSEVGNAEAVYIGSDDSLWQSNPDAAGPYLETDNNNAIRSSFFASSIASEAIEVNEGVVGTVIEFNTFESGSLTGLAGDTGLIRAEGNETTIRYNTFYHETDMNLEEVITIADASEAWHSQDWGENTRIYQNEFLLSGANVPVVRASSVATYVAENFREEGASPTYAGTGIDQSSFSVPFHQFRMASDQSLCVTAGDFAVNEDITATVAESAACADSDLNMQWKIITDGDGYVRIQNAADSELYLYPVSSFINGCSSASVTQSLIRVNPLGPEGMIYSWKILYRGDDALLFNRSNENFMMSALGDQDGALQANSPVLMCQASSHEFQRFRLVEQ